jgi:hypothetical protein
METHQLSEKALAKIQKMIQKRRREKKASSSGLAPKVNDEESYDSFLAAKLAITAWWCVIINKGPSNTYFAVTAGVHAMWPLETCEISVSPLEGGATIASAQLSVSPPATFTFVNAFADTNLPTQGTLVSSVISGTMQFNETSGNPFSYQIPLYVYEFNYGSTDGE